MVGLEFTSFASLAIACTRVFMCSRARLVVFKDKAVPRSKSSDTQRT